MNIKKTTLTITLIMILMISMTLTTLNAQAQSHYYLDITDTGYDYSAVEALATNADIVYALLYPAIDDYDFTGHSLLKVKSDGSYINVHIRTEEKVFSMEHYGTNLYIAFENGIGVTSDDLGDTSMTKYKYTDSNENTFQIRDIYTDGTVIFGVGNITLSRENYPGFIVISATDLTRVYYAGYFKIPEELKDPVPVWIYGMKDPAFGYYHVAMMISGVDVEGNIHLLLYNAKFDPDTPSASITTTYDLTQSDTNTVSLLTHNSASATYDKENDILFIAFADSNNYTYYIYIKGFFFGQPDMDEVYIGPSAKNDPMVRGFYIGYPGNGKLYIVGTTYNTASRDMDPFMMEIDPQDIATASIWILHGDYDETMPGGPYAASADLYVFAGGSTDSFKDNTNASFIVLMSPSLPDGTQYAWSGSGPLISEPDKGPIVITKTYSTTRINTISTLDNPHIEDLKLSAVTNTITISKPTIKTYLGLEDTTPVPVPELGWVIGLVAAFVLVYFVSRRF